MGKGLIFDVGMENGDDSAYYLSNGFRVVAVEANPVSAEHGRMRFAKEIALGQLHLVETAIASEEHEATFWVCDDEPAWSSFDRQIASRENSRNHSVTVHCRRFASLIAEFGVPYYCKIDIEGHEHHCLNDLSTTTRPQYISIEMAEERQTLDLDLLRDLGYTQFKLIDQLRYCTAIPAIYMLEAKARRLGRAVSALDRFTRCRGLKYPFTRGMSGPFADDTLGRWSDYEATIAKMRVLLRTFGGSGASVPWPTWFDIHATAG